MKKTALHAVYVVDDDADDRQIISDAFDEINHATELTLIQNGTELMENLHGSPLPKLPSLIILDLNMPGKDGREILKEVKESKVLRHIPIVVFTTSSFDKDRETCYHLGANCFVTKPSSYDIMLEMMQSISKLWLIQ